MSITSVLYLKDEISIASAGAVDRLVGSFIQYSFAIKYIYLMLMGVLLP